MDVKSGRKLVKQIQGQGKGHMNAGDLEVLCVDKMSDKVGIRIVCVIIAALN